MLKIFCPRSTIVQYESFNRKFPSCHMPPVKLSNIFTTRTISTPFAPQIGTCPDQIGFRPDQIGFMPDQIGTRPAILGQD